MLLVDPTNSVAIAKPGAREASLPARVGRGPLGIVSRDVLNGCGVVTTIAGMGSVGQVATAGNPTMRSLLNRAMVCGVM